MAVPDEVRKLLDQIEAGDRRADEIARPLTDAQFHWQPDDGRGWSVAQCLDHLATANRVYGQAMRMAIEAARANGWRHRGPIASTIFGRWFMASMEPPVKRRLRAPSKILPVSTGSRAEILAAYHDAHREIRMMIEGAADLDLNRATFVNPFISWVKVRVGTALGIIAAHDRRHLWQAERVVEAEARSVRRARTG